MYDNMWCTLWGYSRPRVQGPKPLAVESPQGLGCSEPRTVLCLGQERPLGLCGAFTSYGLLNNSFELYCADRRTDLSLAVLTH